MRTRVAIGSTVVAAAAAVATFGLENTSGPTRTAGMSEAASPRPARFGGVREDCTTRSEANFPGAFTSPRNMVVGPLVLIGGAFTDASTVREFGGNKFPLLVEAGHQVTVRIARSARASAGLAYGPLPQGRETKLRDTHQSVTFVACRPGKAPRDYSPDGPSGSYADGVAITFWSGFVLTRAPACVQLEVYVDDEPEPRRAGLALGRRCGGQPAAAGTVQPDDPSRVTYIP